MFSDTDHCWQGWYMGVQCIILNTDRFDKELAPKGLERPKTWDDLLDSRYKDVLVWANPSTAGGAYIFTACQIFRLGEDKAWEYLKALDANVHHYYEAAGGVISPVATGEFITSIAWAHALEGNPDGGELEELDHFINNTSIRVRLLYGKRVIDLPGDACGVDWAGNPITKCDMRFFSFL